MAFPPAVEQDIDPRWAWEPYRPSDAAPWNLQRVGHLYRRAAFGATHAELQAGLHDGHERTLERLLRGGDLAAFERTTGSQSSLTEGIRSANTGDLATSWWLYRMLYSPHPLREKLTLFWHNHFATSNLKVNNAAAMLGQYQLMYEHAQGSFRTLLTRMSEDPAMLVWLDTVESTRQRPNENYARELMELFSLGIRNPLQPSQRNYTEQDIREAARAFTGWRVVEGRAVFEPRQHDDTDKNVMGQRGRWQGRDVVRICLEQPAAPYFIATKLFRFLISETIPATPTLLEPLATQFRRDYDFGALVERMLRSNLFFAPQAYRSKLKSPVELALGIAHALEARVNTVALAEALTGLGQRLFYPPSVAGWDGGQAWLNGQTLLFRHNLALALTSTQDNRFLRRPDPAAVLRQHQRGTEEAQLAFLLDLFLQGDVPPTARERLRDYQQQARGHVVPAFWTREDAADQRARTLSHLVLTLPEYQLA